MTTITTTTSHEFPHIVNVFRTPWRVTISYSVALGWTLTLIPDDELSLMLTDKQATYLLQFMLHRAQAHDAVGRQPEWLRPACPTLRQP